MPLDDYGVLAGALVGHHRDNPDDQGKWFHVHLEVSADGHEYDCAIDVDSHQMENGVEWKTVPLTESEWTWLEELADGYHDLASNESSGAIDYIRTRQFRVKSGCMAVMPNALFIVLNLLFEAWIQPRWHSGSYADATDALERLLVDVRRVYVFGEPFDPGQFGMHNIHQNQGDPAGSDWWDENGIWQDGGTIIQRKDGTMTAFLSKFATQAYRTDSNGHPV